MKSGLVVLLGEEDWSEEGSARDSEDGVGGSLLVKLSLFRGREVLVGKGRRYEGRGRV